MSPSKKIYTTIDKYERITSKASEKNVIQYKCY